MDELRFQLLATQDELLEARQQVRYISTIILHSISCILRLAFVMQIDCLSRAAPPLPLQSAVAFEFEAMRSELEQVRVHGEDWVLYAVIYFGKFCTIYGEDGLTSY